LFDYDKCLWSTTLRRINGLGLYDRKIKPFNKNAIELKHVQEEVREICSFFGVKALYGKGNVPTNKLMILECDINIPLFSLEDFGWEKYPNVIHRPIDEERFFYAMGT
jgi:hypothetical protein